MKKNPRVLVVDDDANLRKTLCDIMRLKGYDVASAADGAEGIAAAERAFVNVALIDLMLPDMPGLDVMTRIRAISPLSEAIILTGHASLSTAVEATNKGAFSYLLKPYEIEDLLLHMRRAIERQRGQQEILRLASFPQMNPNPVLEVDAEGELTYLNPAAERLFPELLVAKPLSGMLGDISMVTSSGERQEVVREISIGNAIFEQFLSPVPDSDLLRIYMRDITERKEHEIKLGRLNHLLLTIRNINEYLLIAESEGALYSFVCETLNRFEGVAGVIVAVKPTDCVLKPVAWSGFSEDAMADLFIPIDAACLNAESAAGAVCEGLRVTDIENDPRYFPWREFARTWQLKSAVTVPLIADGKALGELMIYSGQRSAFDEEIACFLVGVAGDIALGVRSLRLGRDLRVTLDHLRSSMNSTVEAIARMVELRDPYTAGHERRVAQLASAIGKRMGLPERQLEGLNVIGHLHDIGKIAVPAEILSKPSRLTEVELLLVRSHAQTGYEILKNLEFPWPVAQAVLQHHERLDGSGYPQGLKRPDIIIEAKILMVADVVEAMASHRPYRAAIGQKRALAEIVENAGKYYDEQVVANCIDLFNEQGFEFDSHF